MLMAHLTGAWSERPGLAVGSKHGQRGESINEYRQSSLAENWRDGLWPVKVWGAYLWAGSMRERVSRSELRAALGRKCLEDEVVSSSSG